MDVVLGDKEANQRKVLAMIGDGLRQEAKIFVLPELWTTGYVLDQLMELGEPDEGPSIQMIKKVARENAVEFISGSIPEIRDNKVYNTSYTIYKGINSRQIQQNSFGTDDE